MLDLLRADAWAPVMHLFNLTQKKKFSIFFYSLVILAFLLDFYVIHSSFGFFSYTLIFAISVMLNERKFYKIEKIEMWEALLGLFIIISSFTLVTPVKWVFVPGTRVFGVFNSGVLIIGYFVMFYGLRKYRIIFPFLIFYGAMVILNGTWGFVVNDFAQMYIAPISSHLAYSFLKLLGYPVSISGTTITIISQRGTPVSATVAGACSGIEGMTLSAVMLVGLLMGSKMKYVWRALVILIAALTMFFINVLRLFLTFMAAYYWGHEGLNLAHEWLGNILFLVFIIIYWVGVEKIFVLRRNTKCLKDY
ncbi:Transmembrane exosortase (Exosortase_EpsH) [Aciduliprofundum sp. MAR08-339]|uniref:archaeosortase/exosortase family protein n=1 Tax=Aciduliprofundum sp. (strain MAR08-339) TaxID=673860 RepID=UPI0002A482EB|nr:Transmembrane exosortase (Exosortase_EpsH) [Aciduliprofundum sp. MAR08-339]